MESWLLASVRRAWECRLPRSAELQPAATSFLILTLFFILILHPGMRIKMMKGMMRENCGRGLKLRATLHGVC